MKFLRAFNNLELNKTTEDVSLDIKHMQIGAKLKAYSFYAITTIIAGYSYIYVSSVIKEDDFRKDLITKAGVPPLMSFFYKNYSKDEEFKNKINNQKIEIDKQITAIQALNKTSGFSYTSYNLMDDLKNKSINLDLKRFEAQRVEFLQDYYFSILIQKMNEKVELGEKEYTINEIANRLKSLSEDEAKENSKLPVEKLIEKFSFVKSDESIISYCLFNMNKINYNLVKFYQNLTLSGTFEENLNTSISNGIRYISLNSNNSGSKKIDLSSTLEEIYKENFAIKKEKFEQEKIKFEQEKSSKLSELTFLEEQRKLLNSLISEFNSIGSDVTKYKEKKQKIEELEEKIKWTN